MIDSIIGPYMHVHMLPTIAATFPNKGYRNTAMLCIPMPSRRDLAKTKFGIKNS